MSVDMAQQQQRFGMGCIRQQPDMRDRMYSPELDGHPAGLVTPTSGYHGITDSLPILNQGAEGSCTAFAATRCWRMARRAQYGWYQPATSSDHINGVEDYEVSENYAYWFGRYLLNPALVTSDSGSTIRDAIKALAQYGAPALHMWPYELSNMFTMPPANVQAAARNHEATNYYAVPMTPDAVYAVVTAPHKNPQHRGYGVDFGIALYESFYHTGQDGMVPVPQPGERMIGGHSMTIEGIDFDRQAVRVANQWGLFWGEAGYCWIPFAYIFSNQAYDFWTIRTVTW